MIKIFPGLPAGFRHGGVRRETYKGITPREAFNSGIQVIYQDFSCFLILTVMETSLNRELAAAISCHRKRLKRIAEKRSRKINSRWTGPAVGRFRWRKRLVAICAR